MSDRRALRLLAACARTGKAGRFVAPVAALAGLAPSPDVRRVHRQLGAAEDQLERARSAVYQDLWTSAALASGATVRELSGGFLELSRSGSVTVVRNNLVELDNPVTLDVAGDRTVASERLSAAGLPVAEHATFTLADARPAFALLRAHGRCVVKPAYGTGAGNGVTCDIRTPGELVRAALSAVRHCPQLVIERQLTGTEHRLLVLDGVVVGAVRRRPPSVVGDGRSTVTDLIVSENRRRLEAGGCEGLFLLDLSLDACLALARQGASARSVPAEGARVVVAGAVNAGGLSDCETEVAPPALAADAVAAVAALGLRLASVEVACDNPELGLARGGGGVIEVNSTPGLTYHYLVRDPVGAQRVAESVIDVLLGGDLGEQHLLARPLPDDRVAQTGSDGAA